MTRAALFLVLAIGLVVWVARTDSLEAPRRERGFLVSLGVLVGFFLFDVLEQLVRSAAE